MQDPEASDYRRVEGLSGSTTISGRSYRVVMIENEPFGHIVGAPVAIGLDGKHIEAEPPTLTAGPYEPAVRIEGVDSGDLQGALAAFAQVCGYAFDKVKDWGAYGDPIWQDPRDNAVVLWTPDCPGLTG